MLGAGSGGYANSLWEYDPAFAGGLRMLSGPGTILSVSAGGADEVYAITSDHRLWDYQMGNWSMLSTGDFTSISGTEAPASGHSEVYAVLADTSWWMYASSWSELSSTGALASAGVTVSANLTATITGLPASGDVPEGTKLTLGASVGGGVGADTYSWTVTLGGATVASGAGSSLAFTPTSTGTYQATLTVTDAANDKASANGSVVVDLAPTVSLGGPTPARPARPSPHGRRSNPNSGEAAGFTYAWNFGDGKTGSGTSATISHAYAAAGTYTATVTATDSVGEQATATVTVTVSSTLSVSITGLPSSGDISKGTKLTLGASVGGGVGADTYSWVVTLGGTTVASGAGSSLAFTPTSTGTYQATLTVTDAANDKALANGSVVVDQRHRVAGPYSGRPVGRHPHGQRQQPQFGRGRRLHLRLELRRRQDRQRNLGHDQPRLRRGRHVHGDRDRHRQRRRASHHHRHRHRVGRPDGDDHRPAVVGRHLQGDEADAGVVGRRRRRGRYLQLGGHVGRYDGRQRRRLVAGVHADQHRHVPGDADRDRRRQQQGVGQWLRGRGPERPPCRWAGPCTGQAGSAVTLTASASNPNSGEAAGFTYAWNFGDGKTGSGTSATISHAYAAAGTYTATVTATDSVGEQATATVTVTVSSTLSVSITGLPSWATSPRGRADAG